MSDNTVSILDGSTFLVSSPNGDIDAGPDQPQGLFYQDMRHLSKWKLTLKGIPLDVLSTEAIEYYYAQHFCVPPTGTIYKNPTKTTRCSFCGVTCARLQFRGVLIHSRIRRHGTDFVGE